MQDPKNQIKLKQYKSATYGKIGKCLMWSILVTAFVPIGLAMMCLFGKVRFLQVLNMIVESAGLAILLYVLALLCFTAETKNKDDASEIERSRDGLS